MNLALAGGIDVMLINHIVLTVINDPLSKGALKVFQGWETTRPNDSEILGLHRINIGSTHSSSNKMVFRGILDFRQLSSING